MIEVAETADEVQKILDAEKADKNRKTVIELAEKRIKELSKGI